MFQFTPPIYVVCVALLWVLKKREKKRQYFLLSLVSTICLDQENGDCGKSWRHKRDVSFAGTKEALKIWGHK